MAIAFVGVILLIAGTGQLFSDDPDANAPPDVIRIPVLVASIVLRVVITVQIARAAAASYLEGHPGVSALRFSLTIPGSA